MARIKRAIWLPKFSADAAYVVRGDMTIGGRLFKAGEPFDKSAVTTRRLRQMYESRKLYAVAETEDEPAPEAEIEAAGGDAADAATDEAETPPTRSAVIVEARGWHTVMDGEMKIGKSTRDEDEAAETKRAYEAGEIGADGEPVT